VNSIEDKIRVSTLVYCLVAIEGVMWAHWKQQYKSRL